jgi:uroporphyrinogen decarboxylase
MNGRERILTALDLREPDRVPVWIHAINEISIINIARHFTDDVPKVKAVNRMDDAEKLQLLNALFMIHEKLEIDGFTAYEMGQLTNITNIDEIHFRDQWGTLLARNPHGLAYMVEPPIKDPQDLEHYEPPRADPAELFMLRLAQERFKGQLAQFFLMRGVFVRCYRLRGMEELFVDMIKRPDLVHHLARTVSDYNLALCELVAEAGADVLIVEDDVADKNGPLMSPRHFHEFIAPYNQPVLDRAHELGLKVVRHSDGNLWPVLDALLDMGYDGLNPLEPQAGMALDKVKAYCGDRVCLLGNIDCGELLCSGSAEQVEAAVIQAIKDAAPGGGYILCSSNSIHPGVDPANFLTMIRAAKAHGEYIGI